MIVVSILLLAPFSAYILTGLLRRYALSSKLIDFPNARSSHSVPTPSGGGLGIVVVVIISLALLGFSTILAARMSVVLGIGGATIAAIGWWDDRVGLPVHWRLPVHLISAILVVSLAGVVPDLPLPAGDWEWGSIGYVVLVVLIVWILNLYNFMDGIDGIAGVEAVTVGGVAGALLWWEGSTGWASLCAVVALSSFGFLVWNWPPAKIFMGDGGSGFLGFILGAVAVLTSVGTGLTLWVWLILLGAFIVDASVTLIRRAIRGERVHEAHRDHAYQHAARQFAAHQPVTLAVMWINLLWLAPWAVAAANWPSWGMSFTVLAWAPLLWLCIRFRAGLADLQS